MVEEAKARFERRLADAQQASERLREAIVRHSATPDDLYRDAVIQRFEFTFECVWKTVKVYLEHLGVAADTPRQTIRSLPMAGLVDSEDEVEAWLVMLEERNLTSHTYVESLAVRVCDAITNQHADRLASMAQRLRAASW